MGLSAEKTPVVGSLAPVTNAEAVAARAWIGEGVAVVELRLDAFAEEPDLAAIRGAYPGRRLLATLRSQGEGGRFAGGREEARRLLAAALDAGFDYADVEFRGGAWKDLLGLPKERVIVSAHDPVGIPRDLDDLCDSMSRTGARFVKIIGTARDSRDAVRVLDFQRHRADGRLATFAMGEAGLATRVLSPYLGASLAFGSVVPGRETAPGQIPAGDLRQIYAIGRPRNVEKLFALFGGFVSHSLSPAIHNANFEAAGENALYVPFALRSMLREFDPLVVALDALGLPLKGASVTIPFKEEAATVALFRGESVANTLMRRGDAYSAWNTDRIAIAAFTPLAPPETRALVLGAGGTARAAIEVLVSRRYDVFLWNRDPVRAHDLAEEVGVSFLPGFRPLPARFAVLVNATPVGMKADDPLPCPEALLHDGLVVIDAPYRPGGTLLSKRARELGARVFDGFTLLLTQAAKQAELFTGRATTAEQLLANLPERYRQLFDVEAEIEDAGPLGVNV